MPRRHAKVCLAALFVLAFLQTTVSLSQAFCEEIHNDRISVRYDAEKGTWGLSSADGKTSLARSAVTVKFSRKQVRSSDKCTREVKREEGHDRLGEYTRLEVTHRGLPGLEELLWSATVRPGAPYAAIRAAVRLPDGATDPVQAIELLGVDTADAIRFGSAPAVWKRFLDSGGQGGTRVDKFFAKDTATHASPATLLIHDGKAGASLLLGWLSWLENPTIRLTGDRGLGLTQAHAQCFFHGGMRRHVATDPLLLSCRPDPLVALEEYACEVQTENDPPIRKDTVMGWLSWYCSRLKMTEQFVLDNAKIVAERFRVYGVDTMQVDHGWEHRDIVGHWVANKRFPHGMKWLGQELRKSDLKLGIWMAAGSVSEHAPFFEKHADALIHDRNGAPQPFIKRWTWPPHGKVFSLDPTHPAAREHLRNSLQGLVDTGCRYYKIDFIGRAGTISGVFHDKNRPRGCPMARYEMQQIRDAVGPDSWLRYCSAPTNVYCGIVNIGGATADIGNATGNWKGLRRYHRQLGACWYKHRRFWHNEPDALIVGEGEENEARLRCAWLVMSGGVVALGDDLTKMTPERMSLIPKCLPPCDVAARPLDLFTNSPSRIWDLHVKRPWDDYHVVTLFNLNEQEEEIAIPLLRLGFSAKSCIGWEFWNEVPVTPEAGKIRLRVPGRDCRIVALRRTLDRPQVLATDMHLTMGGVELSDVKWDASGTLSGVAHRAPGRRGRVFIHVPPGWEVVSGAAVTGRNCASVEIVFAAKQEPWTVQFRKKS